MMSSLAFTQQERPTSPGRVWSSGQQYSQFNRRENQKARHLMFCSVRRVPSKTVYTSDIGIQHSGTQAHLAVCCAHYRQRHPYCAVPLHKSIVMPSIAKQTAQPDWFTEECMMGIGAPLTCSRGHLISFCCVKLFTTHINVTMQMRLAEGPCWGPWHMAALTVPSATGQPWQRGAVSSPPARCPGYSRGQACAHKCSCHTQGLCRLKDVDRGKAGGALPGDSRGRRHAQRSGCAVRTDYLCPDAAHVRVRLALDAAGMHGGCSMVRHV